MRRVTWWIALLCLNVVACGAAEDAVVWRLQFGADAEATAVSLGPGGHLFVGGEVTGPIWPGPVRWPPVPDAFGGVDAFVARFDAGRPGSPTWWRQFGGPGEERVADVWATPAGDVVIVGANDDWFTNPDSELPRQAPRASGFDYYLAYYGVQGGGRSLLGSGTGADDGGLGVVPLGDGRAVVAISLGDDPTSRRLAGRNALVVVVDGEGSSVSPWVDLLTAPGDVVHAMAPLDDGSVVLVGTTGGTQDAGSDRAAVPRDAFVARVTVVGEAPFDERVVWRRTFGTPADDAATAVAVDAAGRIVVAGWTEGDLATGTGASHGGRDVFLLRLGSDGTEAWRRQAGTPDDDVVHAGRHLAVDRAGHALVAGTTWGAMQAGAPNAGGSDAFVLKLRVADGAEVWRRQVGTTADDWGRALAVGGDGSVFLAGGTRGAIDPSFGGPGPSAFVVKLRP
jgi:hypothetical protein